ncbi:MAG: hypothetical protein JW915_04995 [Chitinispirillaceae bacterium]|nr:hypothetical protein [Chitinispirillaceae bacterium]
MYREQKKMEDREKLVKSMASKLATGNGLEIIATARKKKKLQVVVYSASTVLLFLIIAIILYSKAPDKDLSSEKADNSDNLKINSLGLLANDLRNKAITFNQYAFYLRDMLIRYDSLPQQYRPAMPDLRTQDVYDSLSVIWSRIDLKNRQQLLKDLPKLEHHLKEYRVNNFTSRAK